MTSDIIQAAIGQLRASVEALSEGERAERWWAGQTGNHWWVNAGTSVANSGLGDTAQHAADHIALTASPHVAEALTEHLAAMQRHRQAIEDRTDPVTIAALYAIAWQTTVALAEAITHWSGT